MGPNEEDPGEDIDIGLEAGVECYFSVDFVVFLFVLALLHSNYYKFWCLMQGSIDQDT